MATKDSNLPEPRVVFLLADRKSDASPVQAKSSDIRTPNSRRMSFNFTDLINQRTLQ